MPSAKLEAKVRAVNAVNAYAAYLYPRVAAILAPFVGRPVVKAGLTLRADVKKALPELPFDDVLRVVPRITSLSLSFTVTAFADVAGGSGVRHEWTVTVGSLNGATLAAIAPAPTGLKADYTADEIEAMRKTVVNAKKLYEAARERLHPFGETDY